jgi:dihydroflavonol-4-reductase
MRIAVTGGTGFVGSHCVRSLVAEGHEVRLLARERERAAKALAPLGVPPDRYEVILGDVLAPASVTEVLRGTEALLHAANVYSLNARDAETMGRVNVEGTRAVLRAAADGGLDPIVHVSSCVALLPSERLHSASPIGHPYGPYSRSKARAETIARELQDDGAPVLITNPGAVYGPHDPHVGESASLVRDILRGTTRLTITGGVGIVDVRDVAAAHAGLLTTSAPRRCLLAGRWTSFRGLFRHLEQVVGHRLPRMPFPGRVAFGAGKLADAARRRGIDPRVSSEAIWITRTWQAHDDADAREALGIDWRPTADTLRDTVAWLYEQGRVTRRQAGLAAGASPTPGGPEITPAA